MKKWTLTIKNNETGEIEAEIETNAIMAGVDEEIKAKIGEREKVITGQYLIERKSFVKKAFTVPESTQYRVTIKRL